MTRNPPARISKTPGNNLEKGASPKNIHPIKNEIGIEVLKRGEIARFGLPVGRYPQIDSGSTEDSHREQPQPILFWTISV